MNVPPAVTETQQQHRSTLGYKVHKQGKLYYSLNMARNLIYDWEHDLKPRVDDHLDNLIGGGDSSTQFILASRHPDQNRMKPSVVILCRSKRGRKVILKSFRGRDWVETFREKNVKLRVIIDTEFGERAGIDSARALPRLSGPNLEISRVSLTSHRSHPSLCGARIKLIHAEELGNSQQTKSAGHEESKSKNNGLATLGGIIAVDGCLYGLTIAHAFGYYSPQDNNEVTRLQSLKDSNSSIDTITTYAASFPSSFEESLVDEFDNQFDAQSFIDLRPQQLSESNFSTHDSDESFNQRGILVALGLGEHHDAYSFPKMAIPPHGSPQHSDWALVQLDNVPQSGNSYSKPGHEELVDIVGVQPESMLRPEEVWIIASRSGIQAGTLSDATASVNLHKSHFTVRQVRLQRHLECGDSGAWVVQDNKLCGIVIAASRLVPWAYILPIEHVFADISLTVGGSSIMVPSKEEIQTFGKTPRFGPLRRSSTHGKETQTKSHFMNASLMDSRDEDISAYYSGNVPWSYTEPSDQKTLQYSPSPNTQTLLTLPSQMDYAQRLHEYANPFTLHHIYPGVRFKELGEYLLGAYDPQLQERRKRVQTFVTLYELSPESQSRVQAFQSAADFAKDEKSLPSKTTSLLFMQGYPSPEWLNIIGEMYHVDPGFYQDHLNSLYMTGHYDRPSMPSYSKDIIRLRITTIGRHDRSCLPRHQNQPIGLLRKDNTQKMKEYYRNIKIGNGRASPGDSIVRQFLSFDEGYFALEQNLTAWVRKCANGWIVIVWLDIGNSLRQSPEGPWLSSDVWSLENFTQLFPTVQSCPVDLYPLSKDKSDTQLDGSSATDNLVQTASFLPKQYGKTLQTSTMASDPFYALAEVIRFAADSEAQFLNFMEAQLEKQRASAAIVQSRSFHSTMDYTITILRRHIQTLEENVNSIDHRGMTNWRPKTVPTAQSQSTAEDLLRDFQYLLHRARNLERSCVDLTTLAEINKSEDDSERAMRETRNITILTYLTLIFLPLSFTSSVFSMNPSLKGQELGSMLAYWILTSILILAITLLFFWFNLPNAQKFKECLMRYGRNWTNWRNWRKGQDASNGVSTDVNDPWRTNDHWRTP